MILIPAYRPDSALVRLVRALAAHGFPVLIVDDGSGPSFEPVFREAAAFAAVIGYPQNGGKGCALKFGIAHIHDHCPDIRYFVTADADGQHAVPDICRVAEKIRSCGGIVLGSRTFAGKVPLRSRIGNTLSRFAYTIASSVYLHDNQTGLRAFESSYCPWLCAIGGERYDYEINVLMYAAKRNIPIHEIAIQTIYENGNRSSHFRPVPDTLRLHLRILGASVPSLMAFGGMLAIAIVLYYLLRKSTVFAAELAVLNGGGAGILMSFFLNTFRFATRFGIPYRLSWRKLLISVIRLAACHLVLRVLCFFLSFPASLGISVVLVTFLEYFALKAIALLQDRGQAEPRTRNL